MDSGSPSLSFIIGHSGTLWVLDIRHSFFPDGRLGDVVAYVNLRNETTDYGTTDHTGPRTTLKERRRRGTTHFGLQIADLPGFPVPRNPGLPALWTAIL